MAGILHPPARTADEETMGKRLVLGAFLAHHQHLHLTVIEATR